MAPDGHHRGLTDRHHCRQLQDFGVLTDLQHFIRDVEEPKAPDTATDTTTTPDALKGARRNM